MDLSKFGNFDQKKNENLSKKSNFVIGGKKKGGENFNDRGSTVSEREINIRNRPKKQPFFKKTRENT